MATAKTLLTKIKLRRDNDYNYAAKKDTFIPLKGEVCLVDVAGKGLKAKVGDGVKTWANLPYTDEEVYKAIDALIVSGELVDGIFYTDSTHTDYYTPTGGTIYIDTARSKVYIYNDNEYVCVNKDVALASSEQAGIVKLYSTTGQNTDGTMTQKAITDKFDTKVEASVNSADELLILSIN